MCGIVYLRRTTLNKWSVFNVDCQMCSLISVLFVSTSAIYLCVIAMFIHLAARPLHKRPLYVQQTTLTKYCCTFSKLH